MRRGILAGTFIGIFEVAWASVLAVTQANLLLFYAGLVVATVVMFLPGVLEPRAKGQRPPA